MDFVKSKYNDKQIQAMKDEMNSLKMGRGW